MAIESVKRNFFQRLLGIPATGKPESSDCWRYVNGKLTIDLNMAKELSAPGGAIRLEGKNLPCRVLVSHTADGDYRAYQNRCTHVGHRRLDPVPGTDTVQCCSVGKSVYDADGEKIHGPAPQAITRYPVAQEEDKLVVTIAK